VGAAVAQAETILQDTGDALAEGAVVLGSIRLRFVRGVPVGRHGSGPDNWTPAFVPVRRFGDGREGGQHEKRVRENVRKLGHAAVSGSSVVRPGGERKLSEAALDMPCLIITNQITPSFNLDLEASITSSLDNYPSINRVYF